MSKHRWKVGGGAVSPVLVTLLITALPAEGQAGTDQLTRWRPIVAEASVRFGIPVDWIERVIRSESAGRASIGGKSIRSKAGAMGLMQLMPPTWAVMRASYHLGSNPDDPHDNIIAGTAFLRMMRDRFGYPGLFAAYSAGPARNSAFLAGRSRLPAETIAYVARLTVKAPAVGGTFATPQRQLLFALRRDLDSTPATGPEPSAPDAMFAIRKGLP